jgi:hypothetical protein
MSESESDSYFSAEEVNALVPRLEEHFQSFWAFRQNAQNILQELRKTVKDHESRDPETLAHQQMRQSQAHFLLERAKKEMDAIMEMGCIIKDLEIGLVDFPHFLEYEEQEVYICWKYGEKKVRFWHGLDEGYTARKPLARKVHPH